jgi:hypothetical protein
MATLVHLTDERDAKRVLRSGLKGQPARVPGPEATCIEFERAVFAMPVLPSYFATHQWLRELKTRGMRSLVGVHLKMRSDALVWVGRFQSEHRQVPLGHAVGLMMREPDIRGWEIIIPGDVPAKAIHAVREVPQVVGWRYFPESHERGPWKCLCDYCLQSLKGGIKSRRLRQTLFKQLGAEELNIESDLKRVLGPSPKRRRRP